MPPAAGSATEPTVVIALGSNLGDRARTLARALDRLAGTLSDLRASRFLDTPAEDVSSPQPPYLNAVAVGRTSLPPRALMARLQEIERELGRERPFHHAPRTIDLDLIFYGTAVIDEPDLEVPHPRFRERRFVLEPLVELAPGLIDPVTGRTILALYEAIGSANRDGQPPRKDE